MNCYRPPRPWPGTPGPRRPRPSSESIRYSRFPIAEVKRHVGHPMTYRLRLISLPLPVDILPNGQRRADPILLESALRIGEDYHVRVRVRRSAGDLWLEAENQAFDVRRKRPVAWTYSLPLLGQTYALMSADYIRQRARRSAASEARN